jgi:hypothetical protein
LVVVTRANDTRRFAPRAVTKPVEREGEGVLVGALQSEREEETRD